MGTPVVRGTKCGIYRNASEKIEGFGIEREEIREMGKKFVRDVRRERLWVQWFHSFRL